MGGSPMFFSGMGGSPMFFSGMGGSPMFFLECMGEPPMPREATRHNEVGTVLKNVE
jgi:hypothetical protein